MPDPPVTLRDVAVRADVHPATASRALNPETRILVSEDTARRVRGRQGAFLACINSSVTGSVFTPTFTSALLRKDFDFGLAAARERTHGEPPASPSWLHGRRRGGGARHRDPVPEPEPVRRDDDLPGLHRLAAGQVRAIDDQRC